MVCRVSELLFAVIISVLDLCRVCTLAYGQVRFAFGIGLTCSAGGLTARSPPLVFSLLPSFGASRFKVVTHLVAPRALVPFESLARPICVVVGFLLFLAVNARSEAIKREVPLPATSETSAKSLRGIFTAPVELVRDRSE